MALLTAATVPGDGLIGGGLEDVAPSPPENRPAVGGDAPPRSFALGTYLVCGQWQALCDYAQGVDRIKSVGGTTVLLSVGDSVALYDSQYLPKPSWMPGNHIRQLVDYVHSRGLKAYAWLGMPHDYWLNETRHPEWISMFSNGTPTSVMGQSGFYRIVPPSIVVSSGEYLAQLQGLIGEIVDMGFDGIDINDNVQFMYDSSFDNFTVDKFQGDVGVTIPGGTIPERATFIKSNQTLKDAWYAWRAGQLTQLLGLLQGYIRAAGSSIPLRPHLMSGAWGYWDWGYDWGGIVAAVDAPYVMLGFGQTNVQEPIRRLLDAGAKQVVTSLYLFDVGPGDSTFLADNIRWVKQAGASEVFLFTWAMADSKGLWPTIRGAVDIVNAGGSPEILFGQPSFGDLTRFVTSATDLALETADGPAEAASVWYRVDSGAWTRFAGSFRLTDAGAHTVLYADAGFMGEDVPVLSQDVIVDDSPPAVLLSPRQSVDGTIELERGESIALKCFDKGVGAARAYYSVDGGASWRRYTQPIPIVADTRIGFYAVDALGNRGTERTVLAVVNGDSMPRLTLGGGEFTPV